MTLRDDVRIIRERLECAKPGATTEALEALDRLEATLPRPTIMEQFEAMPVGQKFRTDNAALFVKVSDKAVVRSYHTPGGTLQSNYYDDVYRVDQYAHWNNYTNGVEKLK